VRNSSLTPDGCEPTRRAVIDVGTNSVKLLVAEVDGRAIRPLSEQSQQTRLGHAFYETHRLQLDAIGATAKAVAAFAAMAREAQAASIRIIATSAAREALNRDELTSAIEQASGLRIDIISGEQEAAMGFQGVTTDPQLTQGPLLLLDVGGGSAQFVFGSDGRAHFGYSFPLGSVRLLESIPCSDPPKPAELTACRQWLRAFLIKEVRPKLQEGSASGSQPAPLCLRQAQLVGVGGTSSVLGCMESELATFDRARLEATRLPAVRVSWHLERLWSLPLEQRRHLVGLPKNRADIILMGVAIYDAVMETFEFPELRISTRGLRFAALLEAGPRP
jgi:exopolyphosphatase / guanosine-5'-triphosphate,3'-diphosphate pyrophosphatase